MTDCVTFFYPREAGAPFPVNLRGQGALRGRSIAVWLADRKAIPRKLGEPASQNDWEILLKKLRDSLAKSGSRGLIVETVQDGERSKVTIWPASNGRDATPDQILELRPGYAPSFRDWIAGEPMVLLPGAHLLVPVEARILRQLEAFLAHLHCLPADVESLVLHSIGQPGLEERVRRLEAYARNGLEATRVPGVSGSASAQGGRFKKLFSRLFAWLTSPLPVWLFVLVLLVVGSLLWLGEVPVWTPASQKPASASDEAIENTLAEDRVLSVTSEEDPSNEASVPPADEINQEE